MVVPLDPTLATASSAVADAAKAIDRLDLGSSPIAGLAYISTILHAASLASSTEQLHLLRPACAS